MSPIENNLSLENPDFEYAWIRVFMAKAKTKKLRDNKEMGERERNPVNEMIEEVQENQVA